MRNLVGHAFKTVLAMALTGVAVFASADPARARQGALSGRKLQTKAVQAIPTCTRRIGTLSIVEQETQWWTQGLGSPEAILKV